MNDKPQVKLPLPFTLKDKSWKTTTASIVSSVGLLMAAYPPTTLTGLCIAAVGNVLHGIAARDNDKTSEQVGANQ